MTEEQIKEVDEDYIKNAMKHLFEEDKKFNHMFEKGYKVIQEY